MLATLIGCISLENEFLYSKQFNEIYVLMALLVSILYIYTVWDKQRILRFSMSKGPCLSN